MSMEEQRTIVVGIDGAHFELIKPWIDAGELPNIGQILQTGVYGDMKSVLPPVTSPNWKAYLTGKNPGKLGIYWWENVDLESKQVYYPSDRKQRQKEFWQYLTPDQTVSILGVPTTYPPKQTGEAIISGAPDGENYNFTYPSKLENELKEKFDYRVTKQERLSNNTDAAADEIQELIDLRFRAAKYIWNQYQPTFLQVTTFYINSLHHFLWNDKRTLNAWKTIDKHIEKFLEEEVNIILMSDHGSTQINSVFHINTWLEENGYLTLNQDTTEILHRFGITTNRLLNIADNLKLKNIALKFTPEKIVNKIPNKQGELGREQKTDAIEWGRTKAMASGQGPVYINLNRDSNDYHEFREMLSKEIKSVTTPDGTHIANNVYFTEDIYDGSYLKEAPDIIIDQNPGIHIQGGVGRDSVFTKPETGGWKAENKRNGLFAATGPSFCKGEIHDLSILDLAPTILHLYGQEIPSDMDGSVRHEIFALDSNPANQNPRKVEINPQEEEIRRIREIARRLDL